VSHYLGGQVAVMAAGLVSMPILTRSFSQADYGIIALVSTTLLLLVALSKGGLQQAAIRFAGRPRPETMDEEKRLQSSILLAGILSSLLVTAVGALIAVEYLRSGSAPGQGWLGRLKGDVFGFLFPNSRTARYLFLTGVLILPRALTSLIQSLMRAEQRSKMASGLMVLTRYLSLALGVGAFLVAKRVSDSPEAPLTAYFGGVIAAEVGIAAAYFGWWWVNHGLSIGGFRLHLVRMCFAYGLPLIGFELASILVGYADKYIISYYKGQASVGLYAAGFGVAEMLPALLAFPMDMAILPHCFRLWEGEGEKRTAEFVASTMSRYAVVVFPTLAMFSVAAEPLMLLVSGEKYRAAARVIPWVVAGLAIWQGFFPMVGVGYYVRKKTLAFTSVLGVGLVFNVALNVFLVPRIDYYGAAITTFLTYAAILVLAGVTSRRFLRVPWRFGSFARAGLLSLALAAGVMYIPVGNSLLSALARIAFASLAYTRLMARMDPDARWILRSGGAWLREKGLPHGWVNRLSGMPEGTAA
jgi:O-antigen/teichoic acid export membrane protein